tara:strand:+ start:827 stop:2338 length:1512 start_codon:yes stop_codon:yes gene_type:complete
MSNGIGKNPLLDISKVYLEQIAEKKDNSYLEPDMKKRQKNNEKARKDMEKMGTSMKNPHFESLDPVGKEDGDVNNDGKKDSTDSYLMKRRKAIGKAIKGKMMKKESVQQVTEGDGDPCWDTHKQVGMKKKGNRMVPNCVPKTKTESFSSWRQDLSEIMTDDIDSKPIKEKKVVNKIKINPKLGEAIEDIGGSIVEMVEVDEAVYGGEPAKKEAPKDTRMTVTNADRKANTPAYQKYKAGDKRYKVADHMKEGVRDTDPEKGTAERKARLEKKRGMKMDDHPQYKKEEVEVDEAMMAGPRKDAMKKKEYSAKSGSDRAIAFNIGTRRDVSVSDPKIKSRGGRADKRTGEGDRGMGNAAKRRMKEEASMTTQELQLQKKKARIDRMIAQKRQQDLSKKKSGADQPAKAMGEGMECVHNSKGKNCPVHGKEECPTLTKEEASDAMKDRRMERGGVAGNVDYRRPPKNTNTNFGKKKPAGGMSALERVKAEIRKKHGQGAIIDTKKK